VIDQHETDHVTPLLLKLGSGSGNLDAIHGNGIARRDWGIHTFDLNQAHPACAGGGNLFQITHGRDLDPQFLSRSNYGQSRFDLNFLPIYGETNHFFFGFMAHM
jgi:hypothetical protein